MQIFKFSPCPMGRRHGVHVVVSDTKRPPASKSSGPTPRLRRSLRRIGRAVVTFVWSICMPELVDALHPPTSRERLTGWERLRTARVETTPVVRHRGDPAAIAKTGVEPRPAKAHSGTVGDHGRGHATAIHQGSVAESRYSRIHPMGAASPIAGKVPMRPLQPKPANARPPDRRLPRIAEGGSSVVRLLITRLDRTAAVSREQISKARC